ncbi:TIGR00730 family Rossman fold protein [Sphingomonas sp. AOB5]|uniref:LOG family protein n=1 Tax=Sphingomonas sp. AOB5 TaxID=3034017 RepID=UPI0023F82F6F|nr:TIGR00730 family Rossman fold protein [Sphingomonas sp. AOB5]MDF7777541.1 TIGR00730 family Rossman fold protein [Sphingomonas sp. AOB5]
MKRIAIYCGSATPADPVYIEAARMVGHSLASRGIGVVYGGGRLGLMGAVADSALAAGGEVIGVIPTSLVNAEVAHKGLTSLEVVDTMHERKARFVELADGFINLPGGTGTMDELWEALSWAQLGYHSDPIGLLNIAGYYDKLVEFWEHMGNVGFVRPQHQGLLLVDDDLDGLLDKLTNAQPTVPIIHMKREDL